MSLKFLCCVLQLYPSKFEASLMFAMRAGAYPNDKHSSLFCRKISVKDKHIYNFGIGLSMLKTLFKFRCSILLFYLSTSQASLTLESEDGSVSDEEKPFYNVVASFTARRRRSDFSSGTTTRSSPNTTGRLADCVRSERNYFFAN
jgi:hypothetical protein